VQSTTITNRKTGGNPVGAFIQIHLPIPEDLRSLWQVIHDAGYDVLFVGGCVRDLIIGEPVHDYDLATSATPAEVMQLFPNCIPTGIRHGTVTVIHLDQTVEVTTFRTENGYQDSRRPDAVVFISRVEEDLQRRDFTCNSMAYRPDQGLLDLFNGLSDLNQHWLRTVGSADERFSEDALRMLRAIRFCSQLDLEPDPSMLTAARMQKEKIYLLSRERIASELTRLFSTRFPQRLSAFADTGIFQAATDSLGFRVTNEKNLIQLLQLIIPWQADQTGNAHDLNVAAGLLAILLTERFGTPLTDIMELAQQKMFMRNLRNHLIHQARFSHEVASRAAAMLMTIATLSGMPESSVQIRVRTAAARICSTFLLKPDDARALVVMSAEILCLMQDKRQSEHTLFEHVFLLAEEPDLCHEALAFAEQMKIEREAIAISELPVRGEDLIRQGVPAGRPLGLILDQMLQLVIRSPVHLDRTHLLATVTDETIVKSN
jgi:tRNA nucleotidyltransferase (CCA-adding enzyme)